MRVPPDQCHGHAASLHVPAHPRALGRVDLLAGTRPGALGRDHSLGRDLAGRRTAPCPPVLTAVVFWQVVWRANYEISVNLLEEIWNQNLVNLFATPLNVWEWSVSLIVLGVLKNVLTLVVGAGAVWLLYRLNVFAVGWIMLPFLFSLLMSGWFMGFTASGVIIRYGQGLQSIAWMAGFALAPFSAVYYPVDVLPRWAQSLFGAADDLRVRGNAPGPPRRPLPRTS